ncbi:response regulator transcription factor [Corynebacterium sp. H130]|uniref:response regulator transcription factor n=1 Tax=Corynebacterium sp. H130 TaxID=3133444 RepID=UPI0030A512D6
MNERINILLVDDSPLVLASFQRYFATTSDLNVVATASNGAEALSELEKHHIDIVLADIHMPTMDGPTLLDQINQLPRKPIFLAITAFDSDRTMLRILKAGGAGYVLKSERPHTLIDAVRAAMDGGMVVSPQAMTRLVKYLNDDRPPQPTNPVAEALKLQTLTEMEGRILVLLCDGLSNAEIAQTLGYAESTVKKRVSSIMDQFGATSRLNLVVKILGGM